MAIEFFNHRLNLLPLGLMENGAEKEDGSILKGLTIFREFLRECFTGVPLMTGLSDALFIAYVACEAVAASVVVVRKHLSDLQIDEGQRGRVVAKAKHLALCYAGFSLQGTMQEGQSAGKAAAIAALYDACSDLWVGEVSLGVSTFERIVREETIGSFGSMAMSLFRKDQQKQLLHDGLERGIVALRFATGLMRTDGSLTRIAEQVFLEKTDGVQTGFEELGLLLQIVDDVIDFEEDVRERQQNCLLGERRNFWLQKLIALDDERLRFLFPLGGALTLAIKKARKKAQNLLLESQVTLSS